VPASARLGDLLADPSFRADGRTAFAGLYSLLGVDDRRVDPSLGCEAGRSAGFECLFRLGAWKKVRRYDWPAILELVQPTGERHRVLLVALGEQSATLMVEGRGHTFSLHEIDELWDGSFILLWKVPPVRSRVISSGMRGEDVEWLWQRLDKIEGRGSERLRRDAFDEELKRRILAFQRSWSLAPDGVVGQETLAHLVLAAHDSGSPSLSRGVQ
jgi:general secretion pathway protein A